MLVRLAMEYDFEAIAEMAKINAETRPNLTFNENILYDTLYSYIDKASPTIWVCEDKRKVIGFFVADIYGYRAFDGHYTTQEVIFVRPEHRGSRAAVLMMKHFIAWSVQIGAKEIIGGNDNEFNSERTAKFLEHFGFKRVGYSMRRSL